MKKDRERVREKERQKENGKKTWFDVDDKRKKKPTKKG